MAQIFIEVKSSVKKIMFLFFDQLKTVIIIKTKNEAVTKKSMIENYKIILGHGIILARG